MDNMNEWVTQNPVAFKSLNLRLKIDGLAPILFKKMETLTFSDALDEIWIVINIANKYIEETAPWKLSKEGRNDELRIVIRTLMEVLKAVAQAVWPFMPATGEGIWKQLGISEPITKVPFKENAWGFFEKGGRVQKGAPLFPRIEVIKS